MPSHPSSLPGPLVVLAAPLLVLPLLLPLEVVASLTATLPTGLRFLLPWRVRCGSLASPVKYLAFRLLHVAYACVYLRIHAYACVYLHIPISYSLLDPPSENPGSTCVCLCK